MALLRRVIGDALRARRQGQHRTLREVSTAANVSLGYLSEIERGQKEASSELLASICEALGSHLSEVLREASDSLAQAERADGSLVDAMIPDRLVPDGMVPDPVLPDRPAGDRAVAPAAAEVPHARRGTPASLAGAPLAAAEAAPSRTISGREVSVSVRRNGPLRTTLHAVRTRRSDQPVTHTG